MIKKLTPIGNSLGLIIDRPILKLLNIDRDTELEISTDGETLIIRPRSAGTPDADAPKDQGRGMRDVARSFLDEFREALK